MKNYIYQKFLLNCNYDSVQLEQIPKYEGSLEFVMPYGMEYCLFDVNQDVVRKLSLEELDEMIDEEADWNSFVATLKGVNRIVIKIQKISDNPIIRAYRAATLQAYCYRLKEAGKEVFFKTQETV